MTSDQPLSKRVRPVIRLFVSSTFSDMRHERNALQQDVFPNLELLCSRNGFQFQAIDLRWGVSSEAGLDHRTMRICFDELRRAQEISPKPNFLILLGNRYGWRPLPEEISVDEFHALERAAEELPTTTDKSPAAVLRAWYRQDENAVPPVYLFQSRRQRLPDGKDYTQDGPWNEVQAVLWEIINRAMPPEQLQGRFDEAALADSLLPPIVRFQASATEQEIWQGALRVSGAQEHVLAFFRQIENVGEFSDSTRIRDFVDLNPSGNLDPALPEEQERLKQALRERLGEANMFETRSARLVLPIDSQAWASADITTDHLTQLCSDVENRMTQIIQGQIDAYWNQTAQASTERAECELKIEQDEHARFGRERGGADSFVGRKTELQIIRDYLRNDSAWPLVVHGSSGCGKTALLARAAEELQAGGATPAEVMVRFIGVTPRSSNLRSLLGSICDEIYATFDFETLKRAELHALDRQDDAYEKNRDAIVERYSLPLEVSSLMSRFKEFLHRIPNNRRLVIFLDALDQISDAGTGHPLKWIPPGVLPPQIKLVVSCLSDRPAGDPAGCPYAELKRRNIPPEYLLNLEALSEAEAGKLLFERWLPQAGRAVSPDQRKHIEKRLASPACCLPIYLKLLFEEARFWPSYLPPHDLGEGVSDLLAQLFARLSQPRNHGPLLVDRLLGYLAASRQGLAENEILELLFRDAEYKKALDHATDQTRHELPANATRIPIALWSRLRFDLAPYLSERAAQGATVLTFYHRHVAEWVEARFTNSPDQTWQPHPRLADYFCALADPDGNKTWQGRNPRPLLELPYHLIQAENWTTLVGDAGQPGTLTDLLFIQAKCEAGLVHDLVTDYNSAVAALPEFREENARLARRDAAMTAYNNELREYSVLRSDWWLAMRQEETRFRRGRSFVTQFCRWISKKAGDALPELPLELTNQPETEIPEHNSERAARLRHFSNFVNARLGPLACAAQDALALAFNLAENGPVSADAEKRLAARKKSWLRRSPRPPASPVRPLCLRTLENHAKVMSVCVSSDGRRVLSGNGDKTLRVWDLETGLCLRTLEGHSGRVTSVSLSPDGRQAVSGSDDRSLRIWDLETNECLSSLEGHAGRVTSVSVSPDGRRAVSGSDDRTLRVWDLETGLCLCTLEGHAAEVLSVGFSPDGRRILSGSSDKTLRLWELKTGLCLRILEGHAALVTSVSVSPDGRRAVSSGDDSTLRVWDLETGKRLRTLKSHAGVVSACITPDGRCAVSGGADKTLRVWELKTGKCLRTLEGHEGRISSVSVSPEGRRAVSGGGDMTLRVWDLEGSQFLSALDCFAGDDDAVSVSPDGRHAVSGSRDKILRVWDLEAGQCLRSLKGHAAPVACVTVNPDGRCAVSGGWDKTLRVWDLETGQLLRTLKGHSAPVACVSVNPDGRRAVSGSWDKTLRVWDLETGECLHNLEGHSDMVTGVSVSPDGRRAVSECRDMTLCYWDLETGLCLRTFEFAKLIDTGYGNASVSVSPDGRLAVSGSWDKILRVWDIETGQCVCNLAGHESAITSVSVSPDGRRAVSGSFDRALRVWDLEAGQCLRILQGHADRINCVSVSPDGRHAVSGSNDKTLRVWDLETGKCLAVYHADSPVRGDILIPSGTRIVCCTNYGQMHFLTLRNFPPLT